MHSLDEALLQAWQLFPDGSSKPAKLQQRGAISTKITEYYCQKRMEAEGERLQQLLIGSEQPRPRWGRDDLQGHMFGERTIEKRARTHRNGVQIQQWGNATQQQRWKQGFGSSSPSIRSWWVPATSISKLLGQVPVLLPSAINGDLWERKGGNALDV